ncbi:hypothetical protein PUN28_017074 [Cardiocondyla obscurior]|uniref:Uncharacterized protein n=1 Tax=Cardiocondyla obscurior TaxID=286306 RepID=A0AAW2EPF4_9HYME
MKSAKHLCNTLFSKRNRPRMGMHIVSRRDRARYSLVSPFFSAVAENRSGENVKEARYPFRFRRRLYNRIAYDDYYAGQNSPKYIRASSNNEVKLIAPTLFFFSFRY